MTDFTRMRGLAEDICKVVEQKDTDYGSSWRRRGGAGAFMVMIRKADRVENLSKQDGYDIFKTIATNRGGIIDDIDDLIGYLLLIREHCLPQPGETHGDQVTAKVKGIAGHQPSYHTFTGNPSNPVVIVGPDGC